MFRRFAVVGFSFSVLLGIACAAADEKITLVVPGMR